MRYISNTAQQREEMLRAVGAGSVEDLLIRIPAKARLARPLNLPRALSESELVGEMRRLASVNDHGLAGGVESGHHSVHRAPSSRITQRNPRDHDDSARMDS